MGSRIRTVTYVYLLILLLGTVFPFGSKISYTLSNNYVLQIRWDYLIHVILYMPMPVLLGLTFSRRPGGNSPGPLSGTHSDTSQSTLPDAPGSSSSRSTFLCPTSPSLYWLLVIGGSLLLTFFYEALQLVIPYRYFNINDMLSNVVGVFVGLIALVLFPATLLRIQTRIFRGPGQ